MSIVDVLLPLGRPAQTDATRQIQFDYQGLGISTSDIPTLIDIVEDQNLYNGDAAQFFVTLHAAYALGHLQATEAIPTLLAQLYKKDDPIDDDWIFDYLDVFVAMGEGAILPLTKSLAYLPSVHFSIVLGALEKLIELYPSYRDALLTAMDQALVRIDTELLAETMGMNGYEALVSTWLDLHAAEKIDSIRNIYQRDLVDVILFGDVEDVEMEFGLRTARETPRPQWEWSHPSIKTVTTIVRDTPKIGRNDPCACGSGKKYKKCCLKQS